jgi:hypothetical protein
MRGLIYALIAGLPVVLIITWLADRRARARELAPLHAYPRFKSIIARLK